LDVSQIVVAEYKLVNTGKKVLVDHNPNGKGAARYLYQDQYGFCIRQNGGFNAVKQTEDGQWYTTITPSAVMALRDSQ
jgi:hypothetical protein